MFKKGLFILLIFTTYACDSFDENVVFENSIPNFIPYESAHWSTVNNLKWLHFDRSNTVVKNRQRINFESLPTSPFIDNQFHPFDQPPIFSSIKPGDLKTRYFDFSQLPERQIEYRTFWLGQPTKVKTSLPQMKLTATEPILNFNKEHGIINGSNVNCFLQDKLGRIWIGTNEGLSVYDGEYSYSYKKLHGLSDKRIWSIVQDEEGLIWVGTFKGLDVINLKNNTISHVNQNNWLHENDGFSLLQDSRNYLWVGTNRGVYIINKKKGSVQQLSHNEGLGHNKVNTIYEDKLGRIWLGTGSGITLVDLQKKQLKYFNTHKTIGTSQVFSILQDNDSCFFLGNANGLYYYQENKGEILLYNKTVGFPENAIISIAKDAQGEIYVGTRFSGLIVINKRRSAFKTISKEQGLNSEYINVQFFDNEQQHWLGGFNGISIRNTQLGGLHKLGTHSGFRGRNYQCLLETQSGQFWIGGTSGVDIYQPKKGQITHLSKDYLGITNGVSTLFQSIDGTIYIGTFGNGMITIDPETGFKSRLQQNDGLGNNEISFISEDPQGIIWIGTLAGLNKYDPKTGSLALTTTLDQVPDNAYLHGETSLSDQIWLATKTGVFVYYPSRSEMKKLHLHSSVKDQRINSITRDSLQRIWIGTDEDGLFIYDPINDSVAHLNTDFGLTDLSIKSLIEYRGHMYVTTNKSLTIIGIRDFQVKTFNKSQGLSSINFETNSVLKTTDQQLWWGNNDGITVLRPKLPESNINQTLITSLDIHGKPKTFTSVSWAMKQMINSDTLWDPTEDTFYTSLSTPANIQDKWTRWSSLIPPYYIPENLVLSHTNNHITFYFSGMYVNEQNQAKYKFILEGLEEHWGPLTKKNSIEYRNLRPGDYVFKVTSCGLSDYCGRPDVFAFTILPPFWQTYWFYIGAVLFLITSLFFYNRYRVNLFKAHTKELEDEVAHRTEAYKNEKERAERSEKFKQQFLANMSHEIRTPMNAVLGMTNLVLDTQLSTKQKKYLQAVQKSSENLLVIINDILDLSKLEAGKMELEHLPFSVKNVINQVYTTLRFRAEEKGLTFKKHINQTVPKVVKGDPTRLVQVLINLIGNAIKFTSYGSVELIVTAKRDNTSTLIFEIIDTGIGIPSEKVDKLFQSFHQVEASTFRKYGGTGLGLSISKTLVELQNGNIQLYSKVNEGSQFTVTIPYEKADESEIQNLAQHTEIDTTRLQSIKILMAEDNEYNQIVAIDTLKNLIVDVEIDVAVNGALTVEMLKKKDYDVILMDVNMPVMDGLEATQIIRTQLHGKKQSIPIIALTASVLSSDIQKCYESGMNGYIPKPFTRAELLRELLRFYTASNPDKSVQHPSKAKTEGPIKNKNHVTDLTYLHKFCAGDNERMQKYIGLYLNALPENMETIESALKSKDWKQLKSTLHSIKPHFIFIGLDRASKIIQLMEPELATEVVGKLVLAQTKELIKLCKISITELS